MGFDEEIMIVIIMFLVLVGIGLAIGVSFESTNSLSQETLDDICQQLLGNETLNVEAHAENGKLICERPSFDNTQNIIFKDNGGEE